MRTISAPEFRLGLNKRGHVTLIQFEPETPDDLIVYLDARALHDLPSKAKPDEVANRLNFFLAHLLGQRALFNCPIHGWEFVPPKPC